MFSYASHAHVPTSISRTAGAGVEEGTTISLLDLIVIAAMYRRVLIWSTTSGTAIAMVFALLLPSRYTATATLLAPQLSSSYGWQSSEQLGTSATLISETGSPLSQRKIGMRYLGLFRSRSMEDALIAQYGLMGEYRAHNLTEARRTLERNSDIDTDSIDTMIHIFVEDRNPRRAAALANGFIKQFQDLTNRIAVTAAAERRIFYGEKLEQAKDNVANAEEALKLTEQRTGMIMPAPQVQASIGYGTEVEAQIAAEEVEIRGIQIYATGDNAELFRARHKLESLRQELASLHDRDKGTSHLLVPENEIPDANLEYARKLRELQFREAVFELLARQFETAKLDEARSGNLIRVVDLAAVPEKPSSPDRVAIVVGASISAFIAGLFIVFALAGLEHLRSQRLTSNKLRYLFGLFRKSRPGLRQGKV